jgi:ribonuclease P protein component
VVCHVIPFADGAAVLSPSGVARAARFGFVSSKAVGNAPTRNRVRRQLREIAREVMTEPLGDVVIRALPGAATARWDDLRSEVHRLLGVSSA